MRALTIHQPYAHMIFNSGKDVENRTWTLPKHLENQWIAIHASKQYIKGESNTPKSELVFGAIIGFVKFTECVTDSDSPWALPDHYHWLIGERRSLPIPLYCRGNQGFWTAPPGRVLVGADGQLHYQLQTVQS